MVAISWYMLFGRHILAFSFGLRCSRLERLKVSLKRFWSKSLGLKVLGCSKAELLVRTSNSKLPTSSRTGSHLKQVGPCSQSGCANKAASFHYHWKRVRCEIETFKPLTLILAMHNLRSFVYSTGARYYSVQYEHTVRSNT